MATCNEALKQHYDAKYAGEGAGVCDETIPPCRIPANRFEACTSFLPSRFAGGDILEIAAGSGLVARSLIAAGLDCDSYTASDFSDSRLEGLRRTLPDPRVRVVRLDADDLPEDQPACYDAIIAIALIEHLIDPLRALQRMRRLLRPGGIAYLDTPNVAKYTRRVKLLFGRFPSTSSHNEGLTTYDLIVLCNVERLTEQAATHLKVAVQGGTGLFLMLGNRSDLMSYSLHLYGAGGEDALMPMRFTQVDGYTPGGKNYFGSTVTAPDHPVFVDFRDQVYKVDLERTPVYRLAIADKSSLVKDAQVLCQVRDSQQSPLLVASSFGEGKVLTLTSHITNRPDRWNRLDYYVTAFRLFFPAAHWLSHPVTDPFNVQVGAALTINLRERPTDLAVLLPERAGGSKELVGDEARALPGRLFALPPFTNTAHAGFYSYEMNLRGSGEGEQVRLPFAVTVDPKEGELQYLSHAVVRDRLLKSARRHTDCTVEPHTFTVEIIIFNHCYGEMGILWRFAQTLWERNRRGQRGFDVIR